MKDDNGQEISCVVCNDKSSGKHYGQFTCEGKTQSLPIISSVKGKKNHAKGIQVLNLLHCNALVMGVGDEGTHFESQGSYFDRSRDGYVQVETGFHSLHTSEFKQQGKRHAQQAVRCLACTLA